MKTILFDLDGTLLPMNLDHFIKNYFKHLAIHFSDLLEEQELAKNVLFATQMMVRTKDTRRNEEVFTDYFARSVPGDVALYLERFSSFYDTGFLQLQKDFAPNAHMVDSIKVLRQKGYRLAIATNPIFPLKANLQRIKWAGLNAVLSITAAASLMSNISQKCCQRLMIRRKTA